jgi:hypothetical protein
MLDGSTVPIWDDSNPSPRGGRGAGFKRLQAIEPLRASRLGASRLGASVLEWFGACQVWPDGG